MPCGNPLPMSLDEPPFRSSPYALPSSTAPTSFLGRTDASTAAFPVGPGSLGFPRHAKSCVARIPGAGETRPTGVRELNSDNAMLPDAVAPILRLLAEMRGELAAMMKGGPWPGHVGRKLPAADDEARCGAGRGRCRNGAPHLGPQITPSASTAPLRGPDPRKDA